MLIDLSKYNSVKDWNKVASAVDGVILRCGYRGYGSGKIVLDPSFESFAKDCKARNIPIGLYFMSQAITVTEAVEEADFCIQYARKYGVTLPIFIDCEDGDGTAKVVRADGLTKPIRTKIARAFCTEINNMGFVGGVYASKSWFETKLEVASLLDFKIWVAQYNTKCTANHRYDYWQYTSNGKVAGISGNVDCSNSYTVPKMPVTIDTCPYAEPKSLIKFGNRGEGVKWVQWHLKRKGYDLGKSGSGKDGIDGVFGLKCSNAIYDLQKKSFKNKKEWDRVVGANTRTVLKA